MPIYDAAMKYKERGVPLVVVAGKEYGTGSSRDWAAKGTNLLGVKAVIAESFERIHRSNLVGMGVLPLVFQDGAEPRRRSGSTARETLDITGPAGGIKPRMDVACTIHRADGSERADHAHLPHRYPRRGRLLPPRRHPALRAPSAARRQRARRQRRLRSATPLPRAAKWVRRSRRKLEDHRHIAHGPLCSTHPSGIRRCCAGFRHIESCHERDPTRAALRDRLLRLDPGPGQGAAPLRPDAAQTCRSTSGTSPRRSRISA